MDCRTVEPCTGVSFEHGAIATNVRTGNSCRATRSRDLGSFYADVFVSRVDGNRMGSAAHYPTVVVENLSEHMGEDFTAKQRAYLGSANLPDYLMIDSTSRSVYRFSWTRDAGRRRSVAVLPPIRTDLKDTAVFLD